MRPLLIILLIIIGMYVFKEYYWDAESNPPATTASKKSSKSKRSSGGLPVDVYVTRLVNKSNTIYATGTVIANEEVEIKSEVSGRLIQLNLREGSYVKKGQMIAKLDDADILAQLKKLKYEEQLASQTEARQKKLLDIDAISKEEYDLAMNKVNTLSADKELLQVMLEKTAVVAPFSGRMGLKNISTGAYVTPSLVIANMVQINPVKLDFTLPEKYANSIKVGQNVTFGIDGNEELNQAKVIAIDPKIDEELRTLKVRAKASNPSGKFLPGMFIRVEVPLGEQASIMIPTEAIIPILKGKKVFVMKNGQAEEAIIKTGLRTDTQVQVEDGLEVGDSVIVSALMSVKSNSKVSLREVID